MKKQKILFVLSTCLALVATLGSAIASVSESSTEYLKSTILSLDKARSNIVNQYLEKDFQKLSSSEKDDFELFMSYLDGRIYYYCLELQNKVGPDILAELPCPQSSGGSQRGSEYLPVPTSSSKTREQQISQLDKNFSASLGEFDEFLLKEQEGIAKHIPRNRGESENADGSNRDGSYNAGYGSTDSDQQSGNSGQQASSSGTRADSEQNDGTGYASSNGGNTGGAGAGNRRQAQTPPTAGNKEFSKGDEDIVAKQLREAAENEQDPEIKAKLWEEYRKYKEGAR